MIISLVEELGLRYVEEYIWNKTNPFPTGSKRRLKDGYERCLHFAKTKDYKFFPNQALIKSESKWIESEKRRKNRSAHNVNNGSGMNMSKRFSEDMVRRSTVITGTSSNLNIKHPAAFPEYLPEVFIKLMTEEGDLVFDPFCGSGTTGVASLKNKRHFVGFDVSGEFIDMSTERLNKCKDIYYG